MIVVWTLKNWELVYALFTFNANSNLHSRQSYISNYFKHQSFFWNILIVVAITMGILILTYIFLALSRLITDFYDKVVTPGISRVTDKSSIVLKSEYLKLQDVIKNLESRLEEERLLKVAAVNERDQIDAKFVEFIASSKLPVTAREVQEQVAEPSPSTHPVSVDTLFTKVINKINKEWTPAMFNKIIDSILNSKLISDSDFVKYLQRVNLIVFHSSGGGGNYYDLTEEGKEFLQYYNRNISDD